jgi:hypothetical protein
MRKLMLAIFAALQLQGCAFFTKPLEQPVIEEKLNPAWMSPATVGTLSLTPERRVVLVNFSNNRFCAEAPTEVGLDLASMLSTSLSAAQGDKAKIEAAFKQALTAQNSVLNKRTQGMQLFLANSYFTCQMYMNGGLDERQMLEMQFQTLKIVEPLISKELALMYPQNDDKPEKQKEKVSSGTAISNGIKEDARNAVTEILKQKSARPDEAPKPSN